MRIVEAIAILGLSITNPESDLNENDSSRFSVKDDPVKISEAKLMLDMYFKSNQGIYNAIKDSEDFKHLLTHYSSRDYPDLFKVVEKKINKIISSKGELVDVLRELSHDQVIYSIMTLRSILTKFDDYVDDIRSPKKLSWFADGLRLFTKGKPPEQERVVKALCGKFSSKPALATTVNRGLTSFSGAQSVHSQLELGKVANALEGVLTHNLQFSQEGTRQFISAVYLNDNICNTYHALINEERRAFSDINFKVITPMLLSYIAVSYFVVSPLVSKTEDTKLHDNVLKLLIHALMTLFIFHQLFKNQELISSLAQNQSIEDRWQYLVSALSKMEPYFLKNLNQSLQLGLSEESIENGRIDTGYIEAALIQYNLTEKSKGTQLLAQGEQQSDELEDWEVVGGSPANPDFSG